MALSVFKYLKSQGINDKITIQKLIYICYGYYWHYTQKELFTDKIEAWEYGTVIPSVYYYTGDLSEIKDPTAEQQQTIDKVLSIYGKKKPFELVDLIHKANTPWSNVYTPHQNNEVKKDDIKAYYTEFLNDVDFFTQSHVIDAFKELAKR